MEGEESKREEGGEREGNVRQGVIWVMYRLWGLSCSPTYKVWGTSVDQRNLPLGVGVVGVVQPEKYCVPKRSKKLCG